MHSGFWRERLHLPAYRVGEAAVYAHLSPGTVSRWSQTYGEQKRVTVPRAKRKALSYLQLIEIAVVAAMREEGVKLQEIKRAREFFVDKLGLDYPFAQARFKTDGVDILVDADGPDGQPLRSKLIAANHNGQFVWSDFLKKRLNEFNYENGGEVLSWKVNGNGSRIEIDPQISFGAPQTSGVPTWIIKDRWKQGEGIGDIADDFGLEEDEVADALKFEKITLDDARPYRWSN